MGKIKTKLIKRTTKELVKSDLKFNEDFENNKKILGNSMPGKKTRNQIAGFISRVKRQEAVEKAKLETKK